MSSLSVVGFWILLILGVGGLFASFWNILKLPKTERKIREYGMCIENKELVELAVRKLKTRTVMDALLWGTIGTLFVLIAFFISLAFL